MTWKKYAERLEILNDKYSSDAEYRERKNEENKARSKIRVMCPECRDEFAYGSMCAHSKRCRGLAGFSILEQLLRLK
jgi:hypothetical protein